MFSVGENCRQDAKSGFFGSDLGVDTVFSPSCLRRTGMIMTYTEHGFIICESKGRPAVGVFFLSYFFNLGTKHRCFLITLQLLRLFCPLLSFASLSGKEHVWFVLAYELRKK